MSPLERMIVERWSGTIPPEADAPGEETRIEEAFSTIGGAYGTALDRLMSRRADMAMTTTTRSAGDDRFDHRANLAALDAQIAKLTGFMSSDPDITLSVAEEALLAQAKGAPGDITAPIPMDTRWARRS